jgi:hypothetical protein
MVMGFFQMQFQCRDELDRAFATVLGYENLEFCAADSSQLRLRFRTRPGCAGPLLERLGIEHEPSSDGVPQPGPAGGAKRG